MHSSTRTGVVGGDGHRIDVLVMCSHGRCDAQLSGRLGIRRHAADVPHLDSNKGQLAGKHALVECGWRLGIRRHTAHVPRLKRGRGLNPRRWGLARTTAGLGWACAAYMQAAAALKALAQTLMVTCIDGLDHMAALLCPHLQQLVGAARSHKAAAASRKRHAADRAHVPGAHACGAGGVALGSRGAGQSLQGFKCRPELAPPSRAAWAPAD